MTTSVWKLAIKVSRFKYSGKQIMFESSRHIRYTDSKIHQMLIIQVGQASQSKTIVTETFSLKVWPGLILRQQTKVCSTSVNSYTTPISLWDFFHKYSIWYDQASVFLDTFHVKPEQKTGHYLLISFQHPYSHIATEVTSWERQICVHNEKCKTFKISQSKNWIIVLPFLCKP